MTIGILILFILIISFVDFLFGFDNGFIIAATTKDISDPKQRRLIIGIGIAFVIIFRTTLAFVIYYLDSTFYLPFFQIIGASLIFYLVYKIAFTNRDEAISEKIINSRSEIVKAVALILVVDFFTSFDNAFGIVSILNLAPFTNDYVNFAIIFFGLIISTPIIFYASFKFGNLIKKSPAFFYFTIWFLLFMAFYLLVTDDFFWHTIPNLANSVVNEPTIWLFSAAIFLSITFTGIIYYLTFSNNDHRKTPKTLEISEFEAPFDDSTIIEAIDELIDNEEINNIK